VVRVEVVQAGEGQRLGRPVIGGRGQDQARRQLGQGLVEAVQVDADQRTPRQVELRHPPAAAAAEVASEQQL
jgi:hypothetical protein